MLKAFAAVLILAASAAATEVENVEPCAEDRDMGRCAAVSCPDASGWLDRLFFLVKDVRPGAAEAVAACAGSSVSARIQRDGRDVTVVVVCGGNAFVERQDDLPARCGAQDVGRAVSMAHSIRQARAAAWSGGPEELPIPVSSDPE